MKKFKFIEKMIQKHNEKQAVKPKYAIEDLYIGLAGQPLGRGLICQRPLRNYTFCAYSSKYKCFRAINEKGLPYNYIIKSAIPYEQFLREKMDEENVDPNTKLSINDIKEAEYKYNKNQEYFTCN